QTVCIARSAAERGPAQSGGGQRQEVETSARGYGNGKNTGVGTVAQQRHSPIGERQRTGRVRAGCAQVEPGADRTGGESGATARSRLACIPRQTALGIVPDCLPLEQTDLPFKNDISVVVRVDQRRRAS